MDSPPKGIGDGADGRAAPTPLRALVPFASRHGPAVVVRMRSDCRARRWFQDRWPAPPPSQASLIMRRRSKDVLGLPLSNPRCDSVRMNDSTITCPKCGADLPLTEAVSHRVREQLEADFN